MNNEHRAGMIEGLRQAREDIDRRLDELERASTLDSMAVWANRIRREELRAAKEGVEVEVREGYARVCRGAGVTPPLPEDRGS